jgi:hypothetical protein
MSSSNFKITSIFAEPKPTTNLERTKHTDPRSVLLAAQGPS